MARLVRAATDRNPPTSGGGGCQTGENGEAKQVGFDFATTEQVNEKANTSLDNITETETGKIS